MRRRNLACYGVPVAMDSRRTLFSVPTGDGWALDVKRYRDPDRYRDDRPPLLFVPGYCMNTYILAFHPNGRSIVEFLAHEGYEVWTANLRGQGDARFDGSPPPVAFADWCDVDIPTALSFVSTTTAAHRQDIVLMGCSLGGSVAYGYLARHPGRHPISAAVALGAPLRWPSWPNWARQMVRWPAPVLGRIPLRGTRRLARALLPVLRHVPPVLSVYMNARHIDLRRADLLTQTVDDPAPGINEDLLRWFASRDLVLRDTNVTESLHRSKVPVLAVYANRDGIVPPSAARSVLDFASPNTVTLLEAGSAQVPFAHADMFINDYAETQVFTPLARWLRETC